jgi:iron complex outermembrane recepter protein
MIKIFAVKPVLLATTLISGPAFAQSSVGTEQAPSEVSLEEIVVTAQKRSENLQDTPIAITAVSAKELDARGTSDISELGNFTPNLVFDTTAPVSGVSSGAIVFIRGVGQTDFQLTTDPGVGTYVDGVYMARSVGGVLDVLDLERVEVLRGPQGTLFGRNTIGGAVSLVTKRPSDRSGFNGAATYGSRDRVDLRAGFDAPLSETIRSKIVASYRRQDGYVKGLSDNRDLGDTNRFSIRGVVEAELSPALRATLSADYTKIDEQNAASKLVGISILPPGSPARTDIRFNRATGGTIVENVAVPPGAPTLAFLYNVVDSPAFGLRQYDATLITPSLDTTFANGPNGTKLNIWGTALTLDWKAAFGDIKSITAYRKTSGSFARDADGAPVAIAHTENRDYDQKQFSQELQLTGSYLDDKLKLATGLYYFRETGNDILTVTLPRAFGTVNNFTFVENKSFAAYAQTTYKVTDALSATAGVRYTNDKKEYQVPVNGGSVLNGLVGIFGPTNSFTPFFAPGTYKNTFNNVSFKGTIDYKPADDTLLYLSYSEGFKSGGFNTRYLVPVPSAISFKPEQLTTYEAGLKWQGFDRRLRLNAAAFHSDYNDIQLVVYESGAPITRNAASANINGFEVEATAVPIEGLNLSLGLGYLDAKYASVAAFDPAVAADIQVTKASVLPNTPKWSLNGSASYTISVAENSDLVLRGDWSYVSRIENDAVNSKFLTQPRYSLFNASITYKYKDNWSLVAFVDNATNKRVITSGDSNYGIGFHEANFNRPREWGVTLKADF